MKRATAVIGSSFGDEGKGLLTDYFVRQASDIPLVVRFNGGAQAGHTVVTPQGVSHVFHHYGAGALAGAYTYLSRHFLVNPILWKMEYEELLGKTDKYLGLFVDREAPLSTIYDMLVNQNHLAEHGTCGVGIHATMVRQQKSNLRLFAKDLKEPNYLLRVLYKIRQEYKEFPEIYSTDEVFERYLLDCRQMANYIELCDSRLLSDNIDIVFEGAQGLLLDAENTRFFPNVTHSRTGLHNVLQIAREANIEHIDATYVVRSYLTRHGKGELPGEDSTKSYRDLTNVENRWQGKLRFAPMDFKLINTAIMADWKPTTNHHVEASMAVTHTDQCCIDANQFLVPVKRFSDGPTYAHVREL
jgi:adenylosuccinate synthase